jgi:hypothetical protein
MEAKSHASKQCVSRPANRGKHLIVNAPEAGKTGGCVSAASRCRHGAASHTNHLRFAAARPANHVHPAGVCEHFVGEASDGSSARPIGFDSSRQRGGREPGEPDVYDDGRRQKLLGQRPGVQWGVCRLGTESSGRHRDRLDRRSG